jgi:hypothetical protein
MQETFEDHNIASQEKSCDAALMGTNEGRLAHDGNQHEFLGQVNGKVEHLSQLVGLQETRTRSQQYKCGCCSNIQKAT